MTFPIQFEDQGLIVLNGTEGLAPSVILSAAQRGAAVVLHARQACEKDAQCLDAAARAAGLGDRVSYLLSDLEDEQAVEDFVDAAVERLPALNVLIHNLAPASGVDSTPLAQVEMAQWNQMLGSELRLPFMLARRVTEEFLFNQINGRIVYIAYSSGEGPGDYGIAQAGLRALVRCLTKEYGKRQLAYNAVVLHAEGPAEATPESPLVETVMFFASSEASFVNGEFLDLNVEARDKTPITVEEPIA